MFEGRVRSFRPKCLRIHKVPILLTFGNLKEKFLIILNVQLKLKTNIVVQFDPVADFKHFSRVGGL